MDRKADKFRKKYSIPFSSLPLGKHEFDLTVDHSFFELFEYSEIREGNLKVRVTVDKKPAMAFFEFDITGTVNLECDRCLDPIEFPVETHQKLVGKEDADPGDEENENLFQLPLGQTSVDLSEPIYEFILLAIPMNKVCADTPKKTCNEEVLKKLNELLVNKKEDDDDDDDDVSPFDILKGLKL